MSDAGDFVLDRDGPQATQFHPFDPAWLSVPIIDLFAGAVRQYPTRTAIDDGQDSLSYLATLHAVRHLAHRIAAQTGPGGRVGILLPPGASFPVAMLACFAAGRLFVPMDLHYPQQWIRQVVEDAALEAVIVERGGDEIDDVLPESLPRIDVAPTAAGTAAMPSSGGLPAPLGPDEPAMVLYTSGSTGRPKGIVNSQRTLLRRVEQYANAIHTSERDRFLPLSSGCTIAGVRERLTALLTGAALHSINVRQVSAREIAARLRRSRITTVYCVPALLRSIVQNSESEAPASLRIVRVAGDAVLGADIDMLRRWLPSSCHIQIGYGSTEAPVMQWFVPPDFPTAQAKMPIGIPLPGNELSVLDDDGQPVAPGEIGELVVRGPYVALGRLRDGRVSDEDFPPDPEHPGSRTHRTGDLALRRPDGLYDLVGRKDRQVKIRGQRVEPAEVEAAILRCAGVTDAAVIGRREARETVLVAYLSGSAEAPSTLVDDVKRSLAETLPPPLRPRDLHRLPRIPRLPSAKIDMVELRRIDDAIRKDETARQFGEADAPEPHDWGERTLEQSVEAIWSRVLKRRDIGLHANFFDIGGDSLSIIQVMAEVEKLLGIELPLTMAYQAPTVSSLSAAIRAHTGAEFSLLVLIKEGADAPPFFIVHGIGGNVGELFELGKAIDHPGPVYAIQSRGLDGREQPHATVADMADDYLLAIRSVQPGGPYYLAGYSFGGGIAVEIARRMRAAGSEVRFVALLDTATNYSQWPKDVWFGWLCRRAATHARTLASKPPREWGRQLGRIAAAVRLRVLMRVGKVAPEGVSAPSGIPPALAAVRAANFAASSAYAPRYYDGALTLITSRLGAPTMCNPYDIWKRLAPAVTTHVTPGTHLSMIAGADGQSLGRLLSRCLETAWRG